MKSVIAILMLTVSIPAFAGEVAESLPCKLEGERAYLTNAEDSRNDDVYVCENGEWTFLYTREWNEGQQ